MKQLIYVEAALVLCMGHLLIYLYIFKERLIMKWIKAIGSVIGSIIGIAGACTFCGIIGGFTVWVGYLVFIFLIGV